MNVLYDVQLEYTGGGAEALDAQLRLLLSTREGSIPLDREFGLNLDFTDRPAAAVKTLYTVEVSWTGTEEGKLQAKVVICGA